MLEAEVEGEGRKTKGTSARVRLLLLPSLLPNPSRAVESVESLRELEVYSSSVDVSMFEILLIISQSEKLEEGKEAVGGRS